MNKRKKVRVWRLTVTTLLILMMLCTEVLASSASVASDNKTVTVKDYAGNNPAISVYSLYDAAGNAVAIGDEVNYNTDIANLLAGINNGQMNASKNACFEDNQDAEDGIAKLTFDVVGKPVPVPGRDVVFILDESGSMNMGSNGNSGVHITNSPCLETSHYYRIPAWMVSAPAGLPRNSFSADGKYYLDSSGNLYFRLIDFGADGFEAWINWDKTPILSAVTSYFSAQGITVGITTSNDMHAWTPWDNHYAYNSAGGTFTNIPCPSTGKFCSPGSNTFGCFDRMMMEKDEVSKLVANVLGAGADVRVAAVGFNDTARTIIDFTTNSANAVTAIRTYNGGNNTNYEASLQQALTLINNRTDTTRRPIIVFISDGEPYPSTYNPTAATLAAFATVDADLYSVGIRVGSGSAEISKIGTYKDCNTAAEFNAYISSLYSVIVEKKPASLLMDTVGTDYALLVDAGHPITYKGVNYTSLAALPPQVKWNGSAFEIEYDDVGTTGQRFSFYVKLDDAKRVGAVGSNTFDTNASAALKYHEVKTIKGNLRYDPTPTYVNLKTPDIRTKTSLLPAAVVSDKMTNNDPTVMGQTVKTGDIITYTITVNNNGVTDADNIKVTNPIPADTAYVNGSANNGGSYNPSANELSWVIPSIPAGSSASVSFKVKVTADDTNAVEEIIKETFSWGWNDSGYDKEKCAGNQLQNPTPVPGALVITNTVKGNAGDPNRDFHYTLTYTDPSGNTKTETFTLKHGESKSFPNLPEGATYTVTETDADTNGYTTNFKQATGTISRNKSERVDFVNEKNVGGLVVTNTVKGNAADPNRDFHYTVTYTDENGNPKTETFTLKHGESKTFPNIPDGATYTVTETDADTGGYTTNQKVFTGKISKGKESRADYINIRNAATPDIPKTGDSGTPAVWLALLLMSAAGFVSVLLMARINEKRK